MKKKDNMEQEFDTVPDLPENFEKTCFECLSPIRIYYRREGKSANCVCGNCGKKFIKGGIKRQMQPYI